jgi:hypothetical protein
MPGLISDAFIKEVCPVFEPYMLISKLCKKFKKITQKVISLKI